MSNVSLRVYNREIETMIEGGQLDEAVAHCQHILKTFPMYVETYRLLGKSFLEARRYTDAADIFQRVIMAVPDDFVAHVGMSIIRDDEGKLDDAIWHMERAFEDQPSNTAIQNELRRLYGRRDGVEPTRIRLSRDALANMYAQGELFSQAITEIRAVLAEDTNRPDLQVMLARAYYRSGQKVEAAEVAANLLKKYNYCLDALRILVDVLPESSQTENTQVYRQRLHMLDPYSSFVAGSVFSTDQVADASVNLERLEYVAGAAPASPQPNWAATLGIKLVEEKHSETAPDWLTSGIAAGKPAQKSAEKTIEPTFEKPTEEKKNPEPVFPPTEPAAAGPDKSVPDWMSTAGWKESTGKFVEEPAEQAEPLIPDMQKPAEPLEEADIPEWLKSMAPQEIFETNFPPEQARQEPSSADTGDIPEWLKGLGTVSAAEPTPERSTPPAVPKDTNVFPDWLKEMDASASSLPQVAIPEEIPEKPVLNETPESSQPAETPLEEEATSKPLGSNPAWLDEDVPFQPTGESTPLKIEDDAMAWLESLAAKQGAKEEELLTKPGERSDEMPDWLRTANEQPVTSEPPQPGPTVGDTLPLEPITPPAGDFGTREPSTSEVPSIEPAEAPVPPINFQTEPEATTEGFPTPEDNSRSEEFQPENFAPSETISLAIPEEKTSESINTEEDSDAWLKGLIADQNLMPDEGQSLGEASSEATTIERPSEEPPLPFNLGEDTQARLDELATGQVSQPEEFQSPPAVSPEEIPTDKSTEELPRPFEIEDDSKAWLEGMAASENIQPEEIQPPIAVSPVEIPPEKPAEEIHSQVPAEVDTDAWLDGPPSPGLKTSTEELPPGPVDQDESQPEWMHTPAQEPVVQAQAPVPEGPSATPEEDITITSWLNKHDVEAALGKARSTPQATPANESLKEDLPDWLKEPKESAPLEKAPEQDSLRENAPKVEEELPEWLSQAVRPVDMKTGSVPAPSIPAEEELPILVDETTPVPEPPAPTTPGEWVSAEEKPIPTPEKEPAPKPAPGPVEPPFQRQILGGTGMLSRVPPEDKDAEFLSAAQTALDAKQIKESMQAYTKLIKKNRLLDEVIHDLREAIYRFPVDVSIWQTLGDAAMRANRLQDALDAYTKAEELLR
jgi:tetratricopeptide (TPR) repeat protein